MAKYKVVFLGPEDDKLEYEQAEMADLDVEFVKANPKSEGEAMEVVKDADAILNRAGWGSEQFIKSTKNCKVLAVYSHGFNHVDAEAATEHGMMITNGAGMCAEEVSNQAVAFTLALNRQVVQYTLQLRDGGKWDGSEFSPIEPLDEQTVGIIGFGNIGRQIARKLGGWRMDTIIYDPYCPPWLIKEYGVEQVWELNDIFKRSDYVITIVPLNPETYHMIGKEQFDLMKKDAFFVNVCRGAVVNEKEMIDALNNKKFRGAGLDVFEQEPADPKNPLFYMPNVIVAPHIAGQSTRSAWLSRRRASQQVAAVLRGERPTALQNPAVTSKLEMMSSMPASKPKL